MLIETKTVIENFINSNLAENIFICILGFLVGYKVFGGNK